ncbi:MAG: translin family protein [Armatimonadetes bacterium]|nr:translin family protein [Armatimonadota bacterium]
MLSRLDDDAEAARAIIEQIHQHREAAYTTSRQVVQSASATIKQVHRGEWEQAAEALARTRELYDEMMAAVQAAPEVGLGGFVADAGREYVEAALVTALIRDGELPGFEELGVGPIEWLNGIGDAVGELRRHVLDLIRQSRVDEAESYLATMDEMYQTIMSFDYPNSVTNGLRGRSDAARGLVERTRGDLTNALRQARLEQRMAELAEKLGLEG